MNRKNIELDDCYVRIKEGIIVIGNSKIERSWKYEKGSLYTFSFRNKVSGKEWVTPGTYGDEVKIVHSEGYFSLSNSIYFDNVDVQVEIDKNPLHTANIHTIITLKSTQNSLSNLENYFIIKKHIIIYPDTPALRIYLEIYSKIPLGNLSYSMVDSIGVKGKDAYVTAVELHDFTDATNNLVSKTEEKYKSSEILRLKGNLLFFEEESGEGLFIWKESPVSSSRLNSTLWDFKVGPEQIGIVGIGFEKINQQVYRRTYGLGIGFYNNKREKDYGIAALKDYQKARYNIKPEKGYEVTCNGWGDQPYANVINEAKILEELKLAKKLGVTQLTIDAGWSTGDSEEIDKNKFPNEFYSLKEKCSEYGTILGLWIMPMMVREKSLTLQKHPEWIARTNNNTPCEIMNDKQGIVYGMDLCHPGFFNHMKNFILGMYKKYSIKLFKLDAYQLNQYDTKYGDVYEHYRAFERLLEEIHNLEPEIRFSMDATRANRPIYHFALDYGSIFLENRYKYKKENNPTKYKPYKTLNNLWQLSSYIPPQKLEIEFCADEDSYSISYLFSIAMFAIPLFWGFLQNISEKSQKELIPLIKIYKEHRDDIHQGHIFPIGDQPTGKSWTGFQSHNFQTNSGYIIIYRENNCFEEHVFYPKFMGGKKVKFVSISDCSNDLIKPAHRSSISFKLSEKNSFRLYKYNFL